MAIVHSTSAAHFTATRITVPPAPAQASPSFDVPSPSTQIQQAQSFRPEGISGVLRGDTAMVAQEVRENESPVSTQSPSSSPSPSPAPAHDEPSTADTSLELSDAEQRQLNELRARDREVRAHEAAHARVGGEFAGSPGFTFETGPDGRQYAVAGEVSIDRSPVPGDPEATIQKLEKVIRAAMAPVSPSDQDRSVAATARADLQAARAEAAATGEQPETGLIGGPGDRPDTIGGLSLFV